MLYYVTLPRSAVGWSAVCDCIISCSYFFLDLYNALSQRHNLIKYCDETKEFALDSETVKAKENFKLIHGVSLMHQKVSDYD